MDAGGSVELEPSTARAGAQVALRSLVGVFGQGDELPPCPVSAPAAAREGAGFGVPARAHGALRGAEASNGAWPQCRCPDKFEDALSREPQCNDSLYLTISSPMQ